MREQLEPVRRALETAEEFPVERLDGLVRGVSELAPEAQTLAVRAIATRLEQLTAGRDGDDARALIEALELGQFNGLFDEQGRALRALAVEALLRLGYPWALQLTPLDLDWYRAQARASSPARWLLWATLAALLSALAGAGWWALEDQPRPAPPIEAPKAIGPASRVEVYRIESGARLAELTVEVPPGVPADAEINLGAIRALPQEGPALEVLRVRGRGLATEWRSGAGRRTLTLVVPLTPERFTPNRRYFFTAELQVDGRTSGLATTASFQVNDPPLRRRDARPLSPTERWSFDAPAPPSLRDPARLLLGIDADGRLQWSQFLRVSPGDQLKLETYLRQLREGPAPMFRPRPDVGQGPSTGGIVDWDPDGSRTPSTPDSIDHR